eukprot:scaffold148219_cov54-Attheya_sp.AAC.3
MNVLSNFTPYFPHFSSLWFTPVASTLTIETNRTEFDEESPESKQKEENSAKKKFLSNQIIPFGVAVLMSGCCIGKLLGSCSNRRSKATKNLSDEELEYVRIAYSFGYEGHGIPKCGQHRGGG